MFGLKYCEDCKSDNERMDLGYNPQHGDCGHWRCHLLELIQGIILLILIIPILIFVIPIAVIINLVDFAFGRK